MSIAYLGLGSNLRDRMAAMRAAVRRLAGAARIEVDFETGIASLYETSPVGGPMDQPLYLNSAVRVATTLPPGELLREILSIEKALGRTRGDRWASRVIDLDLLLHGDVVLDEPALTLPHPRLHQRRFVLEPLSEIAGDLIHPRLRERISTLAAGLRQASENERVVRVAGPSWILGSRLEAGLGKSTVGGLD